MLDRVLLIRDRLTRRAGPTSAATSLPADSSPQQQIPSFERRSTSFTDEHHDKNEINTPRSRPQGLQSAGLHPYLGLRSRLFLSLFSSHLIVVLFAATSILVSSADISRGVATAKADLLSSCHDAEMQASALASLPHWMADEMNARTEKAIMDTVQAVGNLLALGVTAVENLLVFVVDVYRSMYLCFIELLVRGSLAILIEAVELLNEALSDVAEALKSAIESAVTSINTFLSTTLAGLNDVLSLIGKSVTVPQISEPDLSALSNVSLPSSFEEGLLKLNASLPTLADLKSTLDDLIEEPFTTLKSDINSSIANYTFDSSLLPVPASESVTFCQKLDTSAIDDFGKALHTLLWILLGLLLLAALGLLCWSLFQAWWGWRSLNRHLDRTRQAWEVYETTPHPASLSQDDAHLEGSESFGAHQEPISTAFLSRQNLLSLLTLASHPWLALMAFKVSKKLGVKRPETRRSLRWWVAFVAHPMALVLLGLGITGLIVVQVQIWALTPVQKHYESRLDSMLDNFGLEALDSINSLTETASYEYANKTNAVILAAQDDLNDNLFGWVNTTTTTMNTTINELVSGIAGVMNSTFADTPLYSPVQTFVDCILVSKLLDIEDALTWIHDNAKANFSTVSPTILMLSSNRSAEIVALVNDAATGNGTSEDSGILGTVSQSYRERLEKERWLYLICIALYLLVFLIGTVIALVAPRRGPPRLPPSKSPSAGRLNRVQQWWARRGPSIARQRVGSEVPILHLGPLQSPQTEKQRLQGILDNEDGDVSTLHLGPSHQSGKVSLHPDLSSRFRSPTPPPLPALQDESALSPVPLTPSAEPSYNIRFASPLARPEDSSPTWHARHGHSRDDSQ